MCTFVLVSLVTLPWPVSVARSPPCCLAVLSWRLRVLFSLLCFWLPCFFGRACPCLPPLSCFASRCVWLIAFPRLPSLPVPSPLAHGGADWWFSGTPRLLSPLGYLVATATVWASGLSVLLHVCYWLVGVCLFPLRHRTVWQQMLVGHRPLHHAVPVACGSWLSPSESASALRVAPRHDSLCHSAACVPSSAHSILGFFVSLCGSLTDRTVPTEALLEMS